MMTSVEEMIGQYVNAWNGNSEVEFQREFSKCWAAEATYTDPDFENITGVEGISGLAKGSLEAYPIRKFSVAIAPEHHHHVGRYTWKVELPDNSREGFDYFEFNDEFKITKLVSFFLPL